MIALIDYENVNSKGLKGIENLSATDQIYLFHKENSTITISIHKKLEASKVSKEYICVKASTKNALDFQLVAKLGLLCADKSEEKYCIISNDGGFDATIAFLSDYNISRYSNLGCAKSETHKIPTVEEVKKLLPEHADSAEEIAEIIDKFKTKQAINNNLMKKFKSEQVGKIYKVLKPLLKDKT